MEKPFPAPGQDTGKTQSNPTQSSKSLSRKVNSCKFLRPKSKKKSIIPSKISVKITEDEEKPVSVSPSRPAKQRNPSQDRFPLTVFSPLNLNSTLKKSKKFKEVKTEKNKTGKKFTFESETLKKEEKNDEKKVKSKERDQARRLSIQGFKPNETTKVGKSNTIDFKVTKIEIKPPDDENPKETISRKNNRKVIDLNKTAKIEKKSKDFTKTLQKNEVFQEKLKKGIIEKSNRRIQEEIREKNTAEALEKLKKLTIGKKTKPKLKNLKEKTNLLKCIKKKRKKTEDLRPRLETSPKFIKNPEIAKKFRENRAATIIQRWFRSLSRKSFTYDDESDSYHSNGLITEREEWVNFLDSKYSGTNSAFVEEFKAQMLKNRIQVKQPLLDNQNSAKSYKSSSDSDGSTLIIDKPALKSQIIEKKVNVPKLSLSMLKSSEFSFDDDEEPSKYLQEQGEYPEEYLEDDSDSYASVQLVEKHEKVPKVLKKIPNIKSLDLGKIKAYEDSEYQSSQNDQEIGNDQDYSENYEDSSSEFNNLIRNQGKCKQRIGINFERSQDSDDSESDEDSTNHGRLPALAFASNHKKNTKENQKSEASHSGLLEDQKFNQNKTKEVLQKQTISKNEVKLNLKVQDIQPKTNFFTNPEKNSKFQENSSKTTQNPGVINENLAKVIENSAKTIENSEKKIENFKKIIENNDKNLENKEIITNHGKILQDSDEKKLESQKFSEFKELLNKAKSQVTDSTKIPEFFKVTENQAEVNESQGIKTSTSELCSIKDIKSSEGSSLISLKILNQSSNISTSTQDQSSLKLKNEFKCPNCLKDCKGCKQPKDLQNPKVSKPVSIPSQVPARVNPELKLIQSDASTIDSSKVAIFPPEVFNSKPTTVQMIKTPGQPSQSINPPIQSTPERSPKYVESKIVPLEPSSEVFFTPIEQVRPLKIVASYKPSFLQIPEKDSGEKFSDQSPYDLMQTSIIHPADLASPELSSRSDTLEKISESLKSKSRSPTQSPQLSPRFSDPLSNFSTKSVQKTEEKNSKNKNLFNSKLFENNGEPLSERAKKFMSSVVSKTNELVEAVPENNEKNSLLVPSEKIPEKLEKELKVIKSPRREEKNELFKSFNPDLSSSSEEVSPKLKQKLNNHILAEDFPEVLQKLINSEIYSFLRLIPFKDTEREVDSSIEFIVEYLEIMLKELKQTEEDVLDAINTPAYQEPLHKLSMIQDFSTILSKFPTLELILPPDLCSELKVFFHSLELPSRQIYLQMLFDCVNEALNYIRPFGVDGIPDPWSSKPRILFGEAELSNVFTRIISFMVKWATCKAGLFHCGETRGEEDRLLFMREEKMSALLCMDVRDEEVTWLRYEEEETQIKIMTSNSIFESLIDEILTIINN